MCLSLFEEFNNVMGASFKRSLEEVDCLDLRVPQAKKMGNEKAFLTSENKGQELIFYIKEHGTPSSGNPSSLVQIVFQGLNSTTFNGTSGTQTQADRSWALTGPNVPDFRTRFSCVWYDNTVGWILSDRNEPSGP